MPTLCDVFCDLNRELPLIGTPRAMRAQGPPPYARASDTGARTPTSFV